MGPFPSYWIASSSLDVIACTWPYCSILMSLGSLSFSERRWKKGVNLETWEDEGRDWGEVREGKL